MANTEIISMQFHPRAFAAFGADLVTNDAVAVTELVKNCYDAFAYNVEIEFGKDDKGEYIQITDDGLGMTKDVIRNSWAVIATPYKLKNPTVERDGLTRRVTGNKGLGRFSAARLGTTMFMWTKSNNDSYFRAKINWQSFIESSNINDCRITIESLTNNAIFNPTGTIIRIRHLSTSWDKELVDELKDDLSRLISPFKEADKFAIKLITPFDDEPVSITTTPLIQNPLYKIEGSVNEEGDIQWRYDYSYVNHKNKSSKNGLINWDEASKGFNVNVISLEDSFKDSPYIAGPFNFEIRVWDLDNENIDLLKRIYDLKRQDIRNTISHYKGISVYRDNVLVLPKTDSSKDWLGIDLRRISSLGRRLSTSQIIGIVNITAKDNPEIRDTTDREKLVDTQEYKQFSRVLETIVLLLENLRYDEKKKEEVKTSNRSGLNSLIAPLSAQTLVLKIEQAVDRGDRGQDILEVVKEYQAENEKGLHALHDRLTYYAQTASLGSISIVILHEVLTAMTVVKRFLRTVYKNYSPFNARTQEYYEDADKSHARLLDVAKSFAPLYRRDLRKNKNVCDLKETLDRSIRLIQSHKAASGVNIENEVPFGITIKMFDGELQTVFINLLDNACYWIQKNGGIKQIKITFKTSSENKIQVTVSDSGTGINPEDAQSIFEPGVTSKPSGIGMGLVIVTEILNYYDCKIATTIPGNLGGATFVFTIPV